VLPRLDLAKGPKGKTASGTRFGTIKGKELGGLASIASLNAPRAEWAELSRPIRKGVRSPGRAADVEKDRMLGTTKKRSLRTPPDRVERK